MNGPRVIWGRLPELALRIFIIFQQTMISSPQDLFHHMLMGDEWPDSSNKIGYGLLAATNILFLLAFPFDFVRVSWMVAEQIILSRQTQNGGSDEEQFVNWTFCRKARQQGDDTIAIMV